MQSHWPARSALVSTRCRTIWWRWIPRWCWRCSPASWVTVWKRSTTETDTNKPNGTDHRPSIFTPVRFSSFRHHCNFPFFFFDLYLTFAWSPARARQPLILSVKQLACLKFKIISHQQTHRICLSVIVFNRTLHPFTSSVIWPENKIRQKEKWNHTPVLCFCKCCALNITI